MTLKERKGQYYGDSQTDIRDFIVLYSKESGYPATHCGDCRCSCGADAFLLALDDEEGVAVRTCSACGAQHPIADSDEFLEDAHLEQCACPCGAEAFEITIGVSPYAESRDVRWLYVGCRCRTCGLVGVFGDWKNEFEDYEKLLRLV